jgi:hypothetical protein
MTKKRGDCLPSRDTFGTRMTTHGQSKNPMHNIWSMIKRRCLNPTYKEWHLYGGRGITVCDRWEESFKNFLDDMGERPDGMQIDRINNNGPYSPENCRWATPKQNAINRRSARLITRNGITMSVTEWAENAGMDRRVVSQRLNKYKWDIEKALTTPVVIGANQYSYRGQSGQEAT